MIKHYLKLCGQCVPVHLRHTTYLFLISTVHELKMTLPLRREKAHHDSGEIEVELNDLHIQGSSTDAEDGSQQESSSRTITTANAVNTQNGPTTSVAAISVDALANDLDLMQLESPATDRRAGSQSPASTTATSATTTPTSTAGTTSTPSTEQTAADGTERQSVLAVPGTAAAVGAVAMATGGNNRVPSPVSLAPANPPSQVCRCC